MNLDRELRRALKRTEPAPDFVGRVLGRITGPGPDRVHGPDGSLDGRASSAARRVRVETARPAEEGPATDLPREWHPRPARVVPLLRTRVWGTAALAASLLVAVVGARSYLAWQRAAEAERVKAEVALALRITTRTLNDVRQRVRDVTQPVSDTGEPR